MPTWRNANLDNPLLKKQYKISLSVALNHRLAEKADFANMHKSELIARYCEAGLEGKVWKP